MTLHRSSRLLAGALAAALLTAACGGGDDDAANDAAGTSTEATAGAASEGTSEETSEETSEATSEESTESAQASDEPMTGNVVAVDSPAATLTRDLTAMLVDHEYLAGLAVVSAVKAGGNLEDGTFKAAAAELDENSVALSEAIASVYGEAGGQQFLDLWRAHIGFFVEYTLGKATNDQAMIDKASTDLDGYRNDFGAFIEGATEGGLPASAVAEALLPHVDSTKAAIDSVVAGDGMAFDKLREATSHLPGIATALAGAIATQKGLQGTADGAASGLQRDLTRMLGDHEYLAGLAVVSAVEAGGNLEDPTFKAAAATLDANSVELSEAVGSLYGDAGAEQFLSLWRAHIGFFVNYTLGKATNDQALTDQASTDLDGYRNDFGAFIEGATEGGLPAQAVADALSVHVDSTKAAIDSVVAGDGMAFDKLQEAASHLPGIATALSGAFVTQFPDKFTS